MDAAKIKAQVTSSCLQITDLAEVAGETKAAPEKVSSILTADGFFAERKGRGDGDAAIRFLTRGGGGPPREGDELPG